MIGGVPDRVWRRLSTALLVVGAGGFAVLQLTGTTLALYYRGTRPRIRVTASCTFHAHDVNHPIDGSGSSGGLHDDSYPNMWVNDGGSTATLAFTITPA
jgi:hypothetical protein